MTRATVHMLRGPLRTFIEVPFTSPATAPTMESIEVQALALPDGRTGHMVKIQHRGGVVDVYPETALGLTDAHVRSDPAFAHLEIAHVVPTDFRSIGIDVKPTDAWCRADFDDHRGSSISLDVTTTRRSPAPPIFIPAPPQRLPRTLRLLHIDHFWFFAKSRTKITLEYDGAALTPISFPNHSRAPAWSARAGGGNHLVGINIDQPHPDFEGADHCFTIEPDPPDDAAFVITSPIGPVAHGRHRVIDETVELQISADWKPPRRRVFLTLLSLVRRARRRGEHWVFVDGAWST